MKAVAIALTFGRPELSELLACIARQSRPLPTLVYVDDAPELEIVAPDDVEVVYGAPIAGGEHAIGTMRRLAISLARARYQLGPRDALLVLDDDDFYASTHYEYTLRALERDAEWTGSLSMGLETTMADGRAMIEHVRAERGYGQHGTWCYRLGLYDLAGGYPEQTPMPDVALGQAMAALRPCTPHRYCTHVRKHHALNLSLCKLSRQELRARTPRELVAAPRWTDLCEERERFCAAYLLED